jgi:hypothetical protein
VEDLAADLNHMSRQGRENCVVDTVKLSAMKSDGRRAVAALLPHSMDARGPERFESLSENTTQRAALQDGSQGG